MKGALRSSHLTGVSSRRGSIPGSRTAREVYEAHLAGTQDCPSLFQWRRLCRSRSPSSQPLDCFAPSSPAASAEMTWSGIRIRCALTPRLIGWSDAWWMCAYPRRSRRTNCTICSFSSTRSLEARGEQTDVPSSSTPITAPHSAASWWWRIVDTRACPSRIAYSDRRPMRIAICTSSRDH